MNRQNTALEQIAQLKFDRLSGWKSLTTHDQQAIKTETKALADSIFEAGKSRLKIGEHLTKVRDILEPKRMFTSYLKSLQFSRATAYRFIETYEAAKTILPSPVLQVALMRGTDAINARVVKALPPPKSADLQTINAYLDKISRVEQGKDEEDSNDPELLKRECFNFVRTRVARLDMTGRAKVAWMRSLAGMMVGLLGVSNSLEISPSAAPDGYVRPRGRPRKVQSEDE